MKRTRATPYRIAAAARPVFALLGLGVLLSSISPLEAATIRVPADYPAIQNAIDAASPGDTLLVAPGTYVENINFRGKAITLTSEQGPGATTIDGNQAGPVVLFGSGEGGASVLSGFTVRNGRASEGAGISIQNSSPTITGNVITGNQGCQGVGIGIGFGSPLIQSNAISGNSQAGCTGGIGGGGISIRGGSTARILDNTVSGNTIGSANGGGISLFAAGTPTIRNNVIRANSAAGVSPCARGGGISLANASNALIVQNVITGNRAGCGGGIYWLVPSGQPGPALVNNTMADNDGPQGSGIFADGFDAETTLVNNIIVGKAGQTAVFCGNFNDLNPPVFRYNDIFSPSATAYGGVCTDQTGVNGNISDAPLFVDPQNGDYRLQPGSPAIDAGDNAAPGLPAMDLDGSARVLDGDGDDSAVVDMGAYEFSPPPPPSCAVLQLGSPGKPFKVAISGPLGGPISPDGGGVVGNVCIGPNSALSISGSQAINGDVLLAARATFTSTTSGHVGAVETDQDLSPQINGCSAAAAGNMAPPLACDITFTTLSGTRTINRVGATTVVCARDVNLGSGQVVTLDGGASDEFIFVVKGKFVINGGKIKVAGGATTGNILYNVLGTGSQIALSGGSGGASCCKAEVDGTIVAPARDIVLNPGLINGAICGGRNISILNGSSVQDPLGAIWP